MLLIFKSGILANTSPEDELMLRLIGNPRSRALHPPNSKNVHIYDARPYANAFGNQFKGKGYELPSHYPNTEITFNDIDNIHCYKKLTNICQK